MNADFIHLLCRFARYFYGAMRLQGIFLCLLISVPGCISLCGLNQIRCVDGSCVDMSRAFDGRPDCPDGKFDEVAFSDMCPPRKLHCANGKCLDRKRFFDGTNDCGDNSDEVELPCPIPQFTCLGSPRVCINTSQLIDDETDCPGAEDELKRLGDRCSGNDCDGNCTCDVFTPHSVCMNGTCSCHVAFNMVTKAKGKGKVNKICVPRILGDPCVQDSSCGEVSGAAVCRQGVCTCDTGYLRTNNSTCRQITLGDGCQATEECTRFTSSSVCENGTCACDTPNRHDVSSSTCIPRGLDEACQEDAECESVANTSCQVGMCACAADYRKSKDKTYCVNRKLFDPCVNHTDCTSVVDNSQCSQGRCVCDQGRKSSPDMTECLLNELGDPCGDDFECASVANGACVNQSCSCLPGFHAINHTSSCTLRQIYDSCTSDVDCFSAVNESLCFNGSCVCKTGYIENDVHSQCRSRSIGDSCETLLDCASFNKHSLCSNRVCGCELEYFITGGDSHCERRRIGTGSCAVDIDCASAVEESECLNGSCVCRSGYQAAENDTRCFLRRVGDDCAKDSDCRDAVNASFCDNGTCTCISGLKPVQNASTCIPRALLDTCLVHTDCSDAVENTECSDGRCECMSGFQEVHSRVHFNLSFGDINRTEDTQQYISSSNESACVIRSLGDPCVVDTDCVDAVTGSHCLNRTCTCKPGFKQSADGSACLQNVIGDECQLGVECTNAVEDSRCATGKCLCNIGFQVNENKTLCVRRRIFDRTCVTINDCIKAVSNSLCHLRQCICSSGYYPTGGNQTCTSYRIGDRNCKTVLDCKLAVPRSQCLRGECVCDNGYMSVNNGTECNRRVIGDPCTKDVDCGIIRSRCLNETVCGCDPEYEPNPNLAQCVYRPKKLLDVCTFDYQCNRLDNQSICGNKYGAVYSRITSCVCTDGLWVRSDTGTCYAPSVVGDYCEDRSWCHLGSNVQCDGNQCACRQGYLPNATYNGCVALPSAVGDFCRKDGHCGKLAHSYCHGNSTCQCYYKYYPGKLGKTCLERDFITVPSLPSQALGLQCDTLTGRPCSHSEEGRKHWRCHYEPGRQYRCMCVPGFANKYTNTEFQCEEIQTYFFYVNISYEMGCEKEENPDDKKCYIYQPIKVLKQYNNENTKYFIYIRDRITVAGLANLFNDTSPHIRFRYMNSDVLNITEVTGGMRVGLLVYLAADYFRIINDTSLKAEIIASLIRSHGELGRSRLKINWPFEDEIEWRDFDECSERGGEYADCSSIAWCLNTRVSYMCSCRHGYEDWSPDSDHRPGRQCIIPPDVSTDSLSCSNGKCENRWEYISLAIVGYGLFLFIFIGYEIYSRKRKLERSDIYYKLQKAARRARWKEAKERRKTIKKKRQEERDSRKQGRQTGSEVSMGTQQGSSGTDKSQEEEEDVGGDTIEDAEEIGDPIECDTNDRTDEKGERVDDDVSEDNDGIVFVAPESQADNARLIHANV
ncbi:fibrillin-3-like isoform X1 [Mya arenaria]|uniref:fibrillin-3-like isoform X1 n=1 Tax=Mya arenaria TaxID=6604 RepID=UPI0022E79507|nr:fibrillin-3-like isoform X1 [Mya arenaria]